MRKLTIFIILPLLILLSCEKEDENLNSLKSYTVEGKVSNIISGQPAIGYQVRVGAEDTGMNPDIGTIPCTNIGTSVSNSSGLVSFKTPNFAGMPDVCNVEVFDQSGNKVESSFFYNFNLRYILISIEP